MSKNIFKIIILTVILMSATPALAQDKNSNWSFQNLPSPITDLINTFKKIQPSQDFFQQAVPQKIIQSVNDFSGNPMIWLEKLKEWTNGIDVWFKNAIGVGFFEIIKTFVNFFVWILELIIKLLKLAVSAI